MFECLAELRRQFPSVEMSPTVDRPVRAYLDGEYLVDVTCVLERTAVVDQGDPRDRRLINLRRLTVEVGAVTPITTDEWARRTASRLRGRVTRYGKAS